LIVVATPLVYHYSYFAILTRSWEYQVYAPANNQTQGNKHQKQARLPKNPRRENGGEYQVWE
jgi:hypothetical protein